jgi:hypothetical protein
MNDFEDTTTLEITPEERASLPKLQEALEDDPEMKTRPAQSNNNHVPTAGSSDEQQQEQSRRAEEVVKRVAAEKK